MFVAEADPEAPKKARTAFAAVDQGGGMWCSIHNSTSHDTKDCRKIKFLADNQQPPETGAPGNYFTCGEPGHHSRSCRAGAQAARRNQACEGGRGGGHGGRGYGHGGGRAGLPRPAPVQAPQHVAAQEEDGGEFQEANDMACILGGATSFRSRQELKLLTRDLCILQPCTGDLGLLRWSSMPLGFDSKDHPDRTAGVGVLSLVVSPTIRNLRVSKMLVDGGASLNILSTNAFRRLQISIAS